MTKKNVCPVCDKSFAARIPDLCPQCGWQCGADITLFPTLNPLTEKERAQYLRKLDLAKQKWSKAQQQAKAQKQPKTQQLSKTQTEQKEQRKKKTQRQNEQEINWMITNQKQEQEIQMRIQLDKKELKVQIEDTITNKNLNKAIELLDNYEKMQSGDEWSMQKKAQISEMQNKQKSGSNSQDKTSFTRKQNAIDMVFVKGGEFMMGTDDEGAPIYCRPLHKVRLNSFYFGVNPVTQAEWKQIMGAFTDEQSFFANDYPVISSWYSAIKFCNILSLMEKLVPCYSIKGSNNPNKWGSIPYSRNKSWDSVRCNWNANGFRLPTEAEWEYAAQGGTESTGYRYSGSDNIDKVAWYAVNSSRRLHSIGGKNANELGLYDMSGNVYEWCWDEMDFDYYPKSPVNNPNGPKPNRGSLNFDIYRVIRGGSFRTVQEPCKIFQRNKFDPFLGGGECGFRLCRSAVENKLADFMTRWLYNT